MLYSISNQRTQTLPKYFTLFSNQNASKQYYKVYIKQYLPPPPRQNMERTGFTVWLYSGSISTRCEKALLKTKVLFSLPDLNKINGLKTQIHTFSICTLKAVSKFSFWF